MGTIEGPEYFHIKQSQGGIFNFPLQDAEDPKVKINCVGTNGCWNCVSVYVPFDAETCFAAHIDAWVRPGRPGNKDWAMIPLKGSEADLKERVKDLLEEHVRRHMPNGKIKNSLKDRAIVLNVRSMIPSNGGLTKGTGYYIQEAICEFFDLHGSREDQYAHGFVANHISGDREYFRWKAGAPVPTAADYAEWEKFEREHGELCEAARDERCVRQLPSDDRKMHKVQGVKGNKRKDWQLLCVNGKWHTKRMLVKANLFGKV